MATLGPISLCKGLTVNYAVGGSSSFRWNGRSFNPPAIVISGWSSWVAINPTLTYDCTNFQWGNEVVIVVVQVDGSYAGGFLNIKWKDPLGTTMRISDTFIPALGPTESWLLWSGIGLAPTYRPAGGEIYTSGIWRVEVSLGGTFLTWATNFNVTNVPANANAGASGVGHLWVEGDNLKYVPYDRSVTTMKNNGSNYGSVPGEAGHIWVPTSGDYIEYIDENDIKRRTHTGDKLGPINTGQFGLGDVPGGASGIGYPGHAWMRGKDNFNSVNILFMNNAGEIVRIGPGDVFSSGY